MKVSTENDNNFGYEKITILVDNMPLNKKKWATFYKEYTKCEDFGLVLF